MKTLKRLLIALTLLFSLPSIAQVTLEHSYPVPLSAYGGQIQMVYLKHSGFKYVIYHSDSLTFYNLNYSLFKAFNIPGGWSVSNNDDVCYISEGLFDTDTDHIEYIVDDGFDSMAIYKENISRIFLNDSGYLCGSSFLGIGSVVSAPIVTTDSGTFMTMLNTYTNSYKIYKLGGSLPCMPACLGSGPLTSETSLSGGTGYSTVYPNPATTYTDIYYTLPPGTTQGEVVLFDLVGKEIKSYTVDAHFTHLHITTTDVAAGTYIYQLRAGGNYISSKKIIVVK